MDTITVELRHYEFVTLGARKWKYEDWCFFRLIDNFGEDVGWDDAGDYVLLYMVFHPNFFNLIRVFILNQIHLHNSIERLFAGFILANRQWCFRIQQRGIIP